MKILKAALGFIFIHSLLSVIVLYVYTLWILREDDFPSFGTAEFLEYEEKVVEWPRRHRLNVLSGKAMRSGEINIRGWWMAHNKWTMDVECQNQPWGICTKVFSIACRVDSVRAIYQWLPLRKNVRVIGIELSLRSSAEDLRHEASDALYGAVALVKLDDNSTETVTVTFPAGSHGHQLKEATFFTDKGRYISSVTIMLCCYGYAGTAKFSDIAVILQTEHRKEEIGTAALATCPEKLYSVPYKTKTELIHEVLMKGNLSLNAEYLHQITLVTQVSMDRMGILEHSLASWEGPVSLAVYIPFKAKQTKDDKEWQRMYIHKKLQRIPYMSRLSVTLVFGNSSTEEYPINYLRNVAMSQVKTPFLFLADADFIPAPEFQQKFDVVIRAHRQFANRTAWVVPAFEYLESPTNEETPPKTKEDLVEQILEDNANIQPFRITESPEAHRLTDYWHWYRAEHPYPIMGYSDKYEPYVVLKMTPSLPVYDERFAGYGMNKVSHITELFAAGYEFMVLHDLWIIHLPHRTTSYTITFLQSPQKRLENRATRFEFLGEVMRKYHIGSCQNSR